MKTFLIFIALLVWILTTVVATVGTLGFFVVVMKDLEWHEIGHTLTTALTK